MAPRKKAQTPAEQAGQEMEQSAVPVEQTEGQGGVQEDRPGQEPEREADELEQDDQEQDGGEEDQSGQAPERDEFGGIPNPCVYCGPSIRGVARQYTTYQGGIPKELKEFIKAHPAARRLIVPTAKFAAVRQRLETTGTAEAAVYRKVKAEL